MFLITSLVIFGGILLYNNDIIVEKYKNFQTLNKVLNKSDKKTTCANKLKNVGKVLKVCFSILFQLYLLKFKQWTNNTIEHIDKKRAVINYVLNGRHYKMVVRDRKGPHDVLLVHDEDNNDITDLVLPYLGPNDDWHKTSFTPAFWDKNKISFELTSGDSKSFYRDDVINIV
jgi:hypothetical protein